MTLRVVRGVVLDQFKRLVLAIFYGADYHGIHAFCIFSMKIPFLGMEMVKLKQEVEIWGLPCLFTCCKAPIIFNF